MYFVIAYLIGNIKYKSIGLHQFSTRQDAIDKYSEYLDKYVDVSNEFVMVMLNEDFKVLTCWALQTPKKLREAQDLALKKFEDGEDLYIDSNLDLERIFGSTIYKELTEEAKTKGLIKD